MCEVWVVQHNNNQNKRRMGAICTIDGISWIREGNRLQGLSTQGD